jgi:Leucine-rich repeat (LRR) protein
MNEITPKMETQAAITSLPSQISHLIFSNVASSSQDDLRSLRLVNKEFCAAATAAVRRLTPIKSASLFPRFSALETVDFSSIAVGAWSESVIHGLEDAKNLTALRFGQTTQLTPSGSRIIAKFQQLRSIECVDVQLTDSSFRHWSSLTNLTSLSLLGCRQLSESALNTTLGNLKSLEVVELGSCPGVSDSVLKTLGTLANLTKLDLSSCDNFTEVGLAALGGAKASLKTLLLPACWQIDDTMLITLCSAMPNLETLSLFEAGEGVSDAGLLHLTSLIHLTALDLGYSCWAHTSDGLQRVITALPKLKMLNIGGAEGVTDSVLHTVASTLTALTMLDVSECQRTTSEGIQQLSKLLELQELHLGWNLKMVDGALSALPRTLTKLDLSYCTEVSLVPLCANSLPKLAHLHLRRCPLVNDAGLASVTAAAPALQHLDISYCVNITSSGLRCLSTLRALTHLNISACPRAATVLGLGYLAEVPNLISLDVSHLPRLDNGCMQAVSFVSQLRHLKLKECPRITDHGLLALLRIPKLISLEVDGRNVSREAVEKLQVRLPCLRRVRIACKEFTWSSFNDRYERNYNGNGSYGSSYGGGGGGGGGGHGQPFMF